MPGINQQQSSKGPATSRTVPALQAIEAGTPALPPIIGGAYPAAFRGFGQTGGPSSIYNPYRFRGFLKTATVSVVSGATAIKIPFDTIDDDTSSGWNASTGQYTVATQGRYAAQVHVNINTTGNVLANFQLQAYIVVSRSGSNVYFLQSGCIAGTGAAGSVLQTGYDANVVSLDLQLWAGDLVSFNVGQSNSANVTLNLSNGGAGGQYVDGSLHLVSGV